MNFSTILPKHILLFLAFASAAILGSALIGQYGFGLFPCHLCILQRWPHASVIALGLVGALFISSTKYQHILICLCLLALLIGAGIAGYHAGVEAGVFKGPDGCSAAPTTGQSLDDLRAQIAGAALVSCTEAMAYIFGLSMAAWNAILSLVIIGIVIEFTLKRRKFLIRKETGQMDWYETIVNLQYAITFSVPYNIIVLFLAIICTPVILLVSMRWNECEGVPRYKTYLGRLRSNYRQLFLNAVEGFPQILNWH